MRNRYQRSDGNLTKVAKDLKHVAKYLHESGKIIEVEFPLVSLQRDRRKVEALTNAIHVLEVTIADMKELIELESTDLNNPHKNKELKANGH